MAWQVEAARSCLAAAAGLLVWWLAEPVRMWRRRRARVQAAGCQGRAARLQGLPPSANPYTGQPQKAAWFEGWFKRPPG